MGKNKKEMELWEQKLIGRKTRYTDTLWQKTLGAIWWVGGGVYESAVNGLLDHLAKKVNPDIKDIELYGKKMDRPWGDVKQYGRRKLGDVLRSESIRKSLISVIRRSLADPNEMKYVSGLMVGTTCFAAAAVDPESKSPIGFMKKDLAEFYNELGIVPDTEAIIADMFEETVKVKDSNFTDAQWRTYIMPIIISESYKKQLDRVNHILCEEYMHSPSMSKEMLEARLDKAQRLLGKMYQGFSKTLANHTEYLEAPLNFLETDAPHQLTEVQGKPLTEEEKEKFSQHKTRALTSQEELNAIKKRALQVKRPDKLSDYVQAFYRSLSGSTGRASVHEKSYIPKPLSEDHSQRNVCSFFNAIATLKNVKALSAKSRDQAAANTVDLMRENLSIAYGIDMAELDELLLPETSLEDIKMKYAITDEVLFEYEKIPESMLKGVDEPVEKAFYEEVADTLVSTAKGTFNVLFEGGKMIYHVGEKAYDGWTEFKKDPLGIGEIKVELDEFEQDLFNDADERHADQVAEEAKREEERKKMLQQLESERIKEMEKQRREQEEAERKNAALAKLEPWQKKLIGHQIRYSDTWTGAILQAVYGKYGKTLTDGVDKLLGFVTGSMSPKVNRYEVYGKKLDRPWTRLSGTIPSGLAFVLKRDLVSKKLKQTVQRKMYAPGIPVRVGGETVSMACFSPTFMEQTLGEKRPPCHFSKALMIKFYNETGIMPDEAAIVSDMMEEALKVPADTYTDEQWRDKLMPQILKGSYKKQLRLVCQMLKDEYMNNPAMTKEMFRDRIKRAGAVMGEMYQDFSRMIANTTEYLEAPINAFDTDEKWKLPAEVKGVLSADQKNAAKKYKMQSLTSKSKLNDLAKEFSEEERPETVEKLLEQFYKVTSGVIGREVNNQTYVKKPYDPEKHDMINERCMIGAIAVAKKLAALLDAKEESRGFFSKLFGRKKPVEERIALGAMKDALKDYGFTAEQVDGMLDPKRSLDSIKQELGITDDRICGIEKKEIPREVPWEEKAKEYADYIQEKMSQITMEKVTEYAIGTTKIIWQGASWAFKKSKDWLLGSETDGKIEERPEAEEVDRIEANGEIFYDNSEMAEKTEAEEEDEEVYEDAQDMEEVQEVQPEEEEKIEDIRETQLKEEETKEVYEEVQETEEPQKIEEPKEIEESQEIQESLVEDEEQVELSDLEASEQPEGIDEDMAKDLGVDPNQGWMSWGWGMVSSAANYVIGSEPTTAGRVIGQILQKRDDIIDSLEQSGTMERDPIYEKLARIVCLKKLEQGVESERITPEQAQKALDNNRLDKYIRRYTENPGFCILCDKLIKTHKAKQQKSQMKDPGEVHQPIPQSAQTVQQVQTQQMPKLQEAQKKEQYNKQTNF